MSAVELKNQGNAAFSSGDYNGAIQKFSEAIELDPTSHVLFSNRSAAFASLQKFEEALKDAERVVEIKPDWPKGYSRKAAALVGLEEHTEAVKAYSKALELEPGNEQYQQGLKEAEEMAKRGLGDVFSQFAKFFTPQTLVKLAGNPKFAKYLGEPDFITKFNEISRDASALGRHIQDRRIMEVLGFASGMGFQFADEPQQQQDMQDQEPAQQPKPAAPTPASAPAAPSAPAPTPMEEEESEEEKQKKAKIAEAEALKEKGTECYKKRDFAQAVQFYTQAAELCPDNMTYLTNRAAAHYEAGDIAACIADCEQAIDVGRANRVDFKLIAKAMARIGKAHFKNGDFENAAKYYSKSLTEHRTAETLKLLQEAEKLAKEKRERDYLDPVKAEEAKAQGNEAFKKDLFPDAVKAYTEAIKRNPKEAAYYTNRAAAYTKLREYKLAENDCDKALALNPSSVRAYTRKGQAQTLMKEYHKATVSYEAALKLDPNNADAIEGMQRVNTLIYNGNSDKPDEERLRRAQADPEIQAIMRDPQMQMLLNDLQQDPKSAQSQLRDPTIRERLAKLQAAGIIRMG